MTATFTQPFLRKPQVIIGIARDLSCSQQKRQWSSEQVLQQEYVGDKGF